MQAADELFSRNLDVLRDLLAGRAAAVVRRLAAGEPRVDELLEFAGRHGLRFLLAQELENPALGDLVPAGDRDALAAQLRRERERQAALVAELASLQERFARRSIDFVLLKGPYLAERFFGGVDRRRFGDLDLLVHPKDLQRANDELEGLGYARKSKALLGQALAMRFTHGFDYKRDRLRVDLHWSLGAHVSYRIDYDALWSGLRDFRVGGCECKVLSDEHALLFHLLSFFEDLDRGAGRLKTAVDIDRMLEALDSAIDWPGFFARRAQERIALICETLLALVLELFPSDRAPQLARFFATRPGVPLGSWAERRALLEAEKGAMRNKQWAAAHYDCSRATVVGWWLLSLPFRVAVYRPRALRRLVGGQATSKPSSPS